MSKADTESRHGAAQADDRDLYSGLIRLHILHHAAEEPIYGQWIATELARHGYRLGPGTLYPLLHGLERKGYLRSVAAGKGRRARRVYRVTPLGRKALDAEKRKVRELFSELIEDSGPGRRPARSGHRNHRHG